MPLDLPVSIALRFVGCVCLFAVLVARVQARLRREAERMVDY